VLESPCATEGHVAMLVVVQRRWKATVTDDNEADATALLQHALAEPGVAPPAATGG